MLTKMLAHEDVMCILPERSAQSHKGDYGKILLLCGSRGYTGAPALAAMGALRSGAGLVYLGVPESIYEIEAGKLLEPVIIPLPDQNGMFSDLSIQQIRNRIPQMDAVLVGPGMGQSEGTFCITEYILKHFNGPVVLDADGINVIRSHKDILRGRTGSTVLTPHEGEFVRFTGNKIANRIDDAVRVSSEYGVITVLKGHHTVITDGKELYINPTGNPGMAVGGSGDVLAGILTALIGQKIPPLMAAACAAWLHGSAGDICASEIGQYGMLPSDMLNVLPRLLK